MMYQMICGGCGYRKRMPQEQLRLGVRCPRCERFMDVDTRFGPAPSRVQAIVSWCCPNANDAACLKGLLAWQLRIFVVLTVGLLPAYGLYLLWRRGHRDEPQRRRIQPPYRFGWCAGLGEWLAVGLIWGLPSISTAVIATARSGNVLWLVLGLGSWLVPALLLGLCLRKVIGSLANAMGSFCVIFNVGMTYLFCGLVLRSWALHGRSMVSPTEFVKYTVLVFVIACGAAAYGALVGLVKRMTTSRPEPSGGASLRPAVSW